MTHIYKQNKILLWTFVFFLTTYTLIISFYSGHSSSLDRANIARHASIVAYDIWTLNEINLNSYINLAANSDGYETLSASSTEGDLSATYSNHQLLGLDSLLYKAGLIKTEFLSENVKYKDRIIGSINGLKYNKNIYTFFKILVIQFIAFFFFLFLFYLTRNRSFLQQQVRERTKKYYDLVNLLPETIFESDSSGRIVYANKIALKQFGVAASSLTGLHCDDLLILPKSTDTSTGIFSLAQEKQLNQIECLANKPDGESFPVLVSSSPIYTDGKLDGARFIAIDITERVALENQLNRDQKMKSIGLMASGVAHDLNNILSGLVNYPELILLEYPEDQKLKMYVDPIRDSGLQAAAVVSDLLTVARGIAAVKTTVSINKLIKEYLASSDYSHLNRLHPKVAVSTDLDPSANNITCSEPHIRKCLMNLLLNAAEAIPDEGKIIISTTKRTLTPSESSPISLEAGTYSILSVKDNGPGIAGEHIRNIFEPFYSKKKMGRSGTGLGLTIIWNVMQDHGGSVLVNSGKEGTEFNLYFPCASGAVAENDTQKDDWKNYLGAGEKILVIDDEPHQRDIAAKLLETLEYSVNTVSSGEDAVEYLRTNQADLLMLDMIMGVGLNGRETYEKILQLHPGQKAIIVSGFSESDDVKETLRLGANTLLLKPYTIESLSKDIHQALHR